jgi:hypothetical protein
MDKKPSTRVDVVLGPELYSRVLMGAVTANHTPSQEIRQRLSASYGIDPPELKEGNPNPGSARKKKNKPT